MSAEEMIEQAVREWRRAWIDRDGGRWRRCTNCKTKWCKTCFGCDCTDVPCPGHRS